MKPKHLAIRIEQCLALAKASNCPRRKFGALLIDPDRNVILMDGYNGGPRGGGHLCGGDRCLRDGYKPEQLTVKDDFEDSYVMVDGKPILHEDGRPLYWKKDAEAYREKLLRENEPVKSGTKMEIGCHHAEMNVICNAAAGGVATEGAWLICTGEPCMMCSKLIHHAGITKVIVVDGGYIGHNGVGYLEKHGVEVERVDGPKDPRAADQPYTYPNGMQVGDTVRLVRQSKKYNAHISMPIGPVTVDDPPNPADWPEDAVQIRTQNGGQGAVDIDCLEK